MGHSLVLPYTHLLRWALSVYLFMECIYVYICIYIGTPSKSSTD